MDLDNEDIVIEFINKAREDREDIDKLVLDKNEAIVIAEELDRLSNEIFAVCAFVNDRAKTDAERLDAIRHILLPDLYP